MVIVFALYINELNVTNLEVSKYMHDNFIGVSDVMFWDFGLFKVPDIFLRLGINPVSP